MALTSQVHEADVVEKVEVEPVVSGQLDRHGWATSHVVSVRQEEEATDMELGTEVGPREERGDLLTALLQSVLSEEELALEQGQVGNTH